MFNDARTVPPSPDIRADICIIGGGAAGITLAREFSRTRKSVILLESGGFNLKAETQDLYRGESAGLPYDLETSRSRFFGGSTNCWGGFCRPFEPYHFEQRDWIPYSGWPITRSDLEPYYVRARGVIGIEGDYAMDDDLDSCILMTSVAQINTDSRRFGHVYREELKASDNVRVILNANVTRIISYDNNDHVKYVCASTLDGDNLIVAAETFILACGAIENARLMLASNIGNDLVGRYFMEHPTKDVSIVDIDHSNRGLLRPYVDRYALLNLSYAAEFNVKFETQEAERILDSTAHLTYVLRGESSPAVQAFKDTYRDIWRGAFPRDALRRVGAMLRSPHNIAAFALALKTSSERFVVSRHMTVATEQSPNPDSRVTLSDRLDRFGMPMAKLDWRLNDLDRRSMERSSQIVHEELLRLKVLTSYEMVNSDRFSWTWHHMGTTRMHEDSRKGVVDASCRVHGVDNLYVAGSSVFPTAGNHTPTMTIVALALKLADHLCPE